MNFVFRMSTDNKKINFLNFKLYQLALTLILHLQLFYSSDFDNQLAHR